MRRPQPLPPGQSLPQTPSPAAQDATSQRAVTEQIEPAEPIETVEPIETAEPIHARGSAALEEPAADAAIAQVIPLASGSMSSMQRPQGLLDVDSDALTDAATDDPVEPVRLREVWAAARARRKALRAEVRRFTGRQRRRRALWIGGIASVLVLVLATLGAAYSPLFAVQEISVIGADQLDVTAVEAALSDQLGTPLPMVDESEVKAALVGFPLVESYTLEARPPHELVVRIVERTPIGVIQTRAGYTLVDAAGVALSTAPTAAPGMPVLTVEGGTGSAAFTAVGQVMRSLPASILVQVTAVSATTPDDVTLTLGGSNAQVVWGSAEDSAMKALVLEDAMAKRPPAGVLAYDVSSPGSVVFR